MSLVAYDLSDSEPEVEPADQSLKRTKTGYAEEIAIDPTTFKLLKREHETSSGKRRNQSKRDKGNAGVTQGKYAYKGPWAEFSESESEESGADDKSTNLSYMNPPTIPASSECHIPQRQTHIYSGHSGGTNSALWFPNSGHLLLSCGNDNDIRLWDAYNDRQLLRCFTGHEEAVRDISFSRLGKTFVSCSYDLTVRLWDTETGKCLETFVQNSLPNVVRFNPASDNEFLVGSTDGTILQYDTRTNEMMHSYDHHLGAIDSLSFINNHIVSSSDDKTLRLWSWNVNIPKRCVGNRNAIPQIRVHPHEPTIVAQCLDHIDGFSSMLRKDKKKVFKGLTSGTQLDFSPDGKTLISGGIGTVTCWDWETTEIIKKINVCSALITTAKFHPRESWIAAGGTNGEIFIWG